MYRLYEQYSRFDIMVDILRSVVQMTECKSAVVTKAKKQYPLRFCYVRIYYISHALPSEASHEPIFFRAATPLSLPSFLPRYGRFSGRPPLQL
mmetsp:Transcript_38627/g.75345  ORF Transcript_38627/g.75345 Transcript_38627/m.75345 type:complete len:93 (-) Transcript_38627:996-1274(-)